MNENLLNIIYRNIFHRSVCARLYCVAYLNRYEYQHHWILLSTNHPRLLLRHFILLSNVSFSYVNQFITWLNVHEFRLSYVQLYWRKCSFSYEVRILITSGSYRCSAISKRFHPLRNTVINRLRNKTINVTCPKV